MNSQNALGFKIKTEDSHTELTEESLKILTRSSRRNTEEHGAVVSKSSSVPLCPPRLRVILLGIIFTNIFSILSCARVDASRSEFTLGTVCTITLFDQAQNKVYRDAFSRIREIENLMSVNIPSSDVFEINASAGIQSVQVHEDTFMVIQRALMFAEKSEGAFDPTVGPLVNLWGITGDAPQVPSQKEIDEVLPYISWQDIFLNEEDHSVFLKRQGMALDLGGIAKGYAADEAASIIQKAGITYAIIDLGGNVIVLGVKPDNTPWRVGLQNPAELRGSYIGVIQTAQTSVVTSGVNERFFIEDGISYHHIFSPWDGYPVKNNLLSVTIITENSMNADALSTAVFVLGYERGKALAESFGAQAIFVFEDFEVRKTEGVDFDLIDEFFWEAE